MNALILHIDAFVCFFNVILRKGKVRRTHNIVRLPIFYLFSNGNWHFRVLPPSSLHQDMAQEEALFGHHPLSELEIVTVRPLTPHNYLLQTKREADSRHTTCTSLQTSQLNCPPQSQWSLSWPSRIKRKKLL